MYGGLMPELHTYKLLELISLSQYGYEVDVELDEKSLPVHSGCRG